MLDNPDQVERLLAKVEAVLPIPALVTVAIALRDKSPDARC